MGVRIQIEAILDTKEEAKAAISDAEEAIGKHNGELDFSELTDEDGEVWTLREGSWHRGF